MYAVKIGALVYLKVLGVCEKEASSDKWAKSIPFRSIMIKGIEAY